VFGIALGAVASDVRGFLATVPAERLEEEPEAGAQRGRDRWLRSVG
jgi:hypothetical protein